MTEAVKPLDALVTQWRVAADSMRVEGKGVWQQAKRECAKDLEEALAAHAAAPAAELARIYETNRINAQLLDEARDEIDRLKASGHGEPAPPRERIHPPWSFDVTHDVEDAPDGAEILIKYRRALSSWEQISVHGVDELKTSEPAPGLRELIDECDRVVNSLSPTPADNSARDYGRAEAYASIGKKLRALTQG